MKLAVVEITRDAAYQTGSKFKAPIKYGKVN